jgi:hypothetical protein
VERAFIRHQTHAHKPVLLCWILTTASRVSARLGMADVQALQRAFRSYLMGMLSARSGRRLDELATPSANDLDRQHGAW